MKKACLAFLMLFPVLGMGYTTAFAAPDPRDSVILESKSVKPGTGSPAAVFRVSITNKDSLGAFSLVLAEKTLTGNAYMTLSWPRNDTGVVRRLTATLQGFTLFAGNRYNSASPDTFAYAALFDPGNPDSYEPPNLTRKPFYEIKFDTVRTDTGRIVFDSSRITSPYGANSPTVFSTKRGSEIPVNFVRGIITVDPTPPTVAVVAPNGGEIVSRCGILTIGWNATDNVGVAGIEIRLDRTNDGVFEQQIANLGGNPGAYDWTPGSPGSSAAKIKVIATDAAGNSGSDMSDGTFTISSQCYQKPAAGFDFNEDGVVSLVDAVLVINSVHSEGGEDTADFSREYIEAILAALFSSSP